MTPSTAARPRFFAVLVSPQAYGALLYLLLSMATGILAFTYTVTGLSLSLGLAILILGVPVALAFLAGARLLSWAEVALLRGLVGGSGLDLPAPLPAGPGWLGRVKALVGDPRTWTSLLYFLLLLPLGIAYFTLLVTLLSISLALLLAPLALLFHLTGGVTVSFDGLPWLAAHPLTALTLCGTAGALLLPLTFHLALALGRFQTWLARHLLVRI